MVKIAVRNLHALLLKDKGLLKPAFCKTFANKYPRIFGFTI